jgi:glutamate dehydrogenase (NAD(P)+)
LKVFEVKDRKLEIVGWLVVDSVNHGLAVGGIRISPSVTLQTVKDLAFGMTLKLAGHGLPVGGAKAGFQCSPNDPKIDEKLFRFGELAREALSEHFVMGRDLGTSNEFIDRIYEGVGKPQLALMRREHPGKKSIPDKLRELKGYRSHMTGQGVAFASLAALGDLKGMRVLIQGAGAVGVGSAYCLHELGAVICGISDETGAIFRPKGETPDWFANLIQEGRIQWDKVQSLDPEARVERDLILFKKTDLLVLAANSRCIDLGMSKKIVAQAIVEGANIPFQKEAEAFIEKKGALIIPDVIANSSTSTVIAHQLASGNALEKDQVWGRIRSSIFESIARSKEIAVSKKMSLKQAYVEILVPEILDQVQGQGLRKKAA